MTADFAQGCRLLRHVPVRMRDGVCLATTVYLPRAEGSYPTVLVRTAYNRLPNLGTGWARQGFAFVAQDVRGRYGSGGEWCPFAAEAQDGEDNLNWRDSHRLLLGPWTHVG